MQTKEKTFKSVNRADLLSVYGTPFYENMARQLRKGYLAAYDVHKINLLMGIDKDPGDKHEGCLRWYQSILDLKLEAFFTAPEAVLKYYDGPDSVFYKKEREVENNDDQNPT